jgi:Replication-relaxation
MSRVSTARLLALAAELSGAERNLVWEVAKLRLATHAQLAALMQAGGSEASPASEARAARRVLARLTSLGVLARLERRVGGTRAGSRGYTYYLGPVGQRLIAYWQGRGLIRGRIRPEPGSRYVRHRLAVSELYVGVRQADRDGILDLLAFDIEPDCWRSALDGFGAQVTLKPDAFARIGVGAYEDSFFIEVDLGSESRSVIAKKVRAYLDYFNSGQEQAEHGVFPRVLLLTNSEARRAALVDVCARMPAESWRLFTITTLDRAVEAMNGQVEDDAHKVAQGEGETT